MPGSVDNSNWWAIVQSIWSDDTVQHCVLMSASGSMHALGDADADTARRRLVKYRLIYPGHTDLLERAIREAAALTAQRSASDSCHGQDSTHPG